MGFGRGWDGRRVAISSPGLQQADRLATTIVQTLSTLDFDL
jgi:hypothetical protein